MTVVYIDSVFVLNALMDYLLLLSAGRLAGVPLRRGRYVLGALLGGGYAAAVFLPGMEENIFPGMQAIYDPNGMEEERRLAYVAVTRAREELHLLHAQSRMLFGSTSRNKRSRFVDEMPAELMAFDQFERKVIPASQMPEKRGYSRFGGHQAFWSGRAH